MFSWAASTFESLVQTVAPPPSDPHLKFVHCCQQGNEDGAIECLILDEKQQQQQQPQEQYSPNVQSYSGVGFYDGNSYGQQQQQQQQQQLAPNGTIDPLRTIVVPLRGYTALHMACIHAMPKLFDLILSKNDIGDDIWKIQDVDGNTPIHCACMSNDSANALTMVKKILLHPPFRSAQPLQEQAQPNPHGSMNAPAINTALVLTKNFRGQTPYDVASLNSVRQYLLPLQLQAETQISIDNGGVGLPPGIDMGGLKVQYNHLPPPPMAMPSQQQPPSFGTVNTSGVSRYAPPPMPGFGSQQQIHGQQQQQFPMQQLAPMQQPAPMSNSTPPYSSSSQEIMSQNQQPYVQQQPQQQFHQSPQPPPLGELNNGSNNSTVMGSNYSNAQSVSSQVPFSSNSAPSTSTSTNPLPSTKAELSEAPKSGSGYSLVGRSSAAIYTRPAGSRIVPNDGFHSSSSDKSLQAKYGHASVAPAIAIPPPPSSGNAPLLLNATSNGTVPASLGSMSNVGSVNPFAAGGGAAAALVGSRRVPAASRYVSYDPVRGTSIPPMPPPPPPAFAGAGSRIQSAPTFSMFIPGAIPGANHQQQELQSQVSAAAVTTSSAIPGMTNLNSIPPLPPPPSIGSKTTSYNSLQATNVPSTVLAAPFRSPNPQLQIQPTPANTPLTPAVPRPSSVISDTTPQKSVSAISSAQPSPVFQNENNGAYSNKITVITSPYNGGNPSQVFGSPQRPLNMFSQSSPSSTIASNIFSSPPAVTIAESHAVSEESAALTTMTTMEDVSNTDKMLHGLTVSACKADPSFVFSSTGEAREFSVREEKSKTASDVFPSSSSNNVDASVSENGSKNGSKNAAPDAVAVFGLPPSDSTSVTQSHTPICSPICNDTSIVKSARADSTVPQQLFSEVSEGSCPPSSAQVQTAQVQTSTPVSMATKSLVQKHHDENEDSMTNPPGTSSTVMADYADDEDMMDEIPLTPAPGLEQPQQHVDGASEEFSGLGTNGSDKNVNTVNTGDSTGYIDIGQILPPPPPPFFMNRK